MKLLRNYEAGELNKERYKKIMSNEEELCDILNIYMKIYEKGITSYGMTQEELQKEFEALLSDHNIDDKRGNRG